MLLKGSASIFSVNSVLLALMRVLFWLGLMISYSICTEGGRSLLLPLNASCEAEDLYLKVGSATS